MKTFLAVFFGIIAAAFVLMFLVSAAAYYDLRSEGYTPDSHGNWQKEVVIK